MELILGISVISHLCRSSSFSSDGSDVTGSPLVFENICVEDREKDVRIVYVWVGLRSLKGWYGPNHWSVILKLSNGQYVCQQKNTNHYVACKVENSLGDAARQTWGEKGRKVRTSCYGECDVSWSTFHSEFTEYSEYTFFTGDCQNYARKLVDYLNKKTVGLFPSENGPEFW
ncbi:hypothetical protein DLAC_04511 [Tieghemostelium lacteum]|uniref:Uncharacterized protein n=1 Tax=Tieghemostelium lacteum TaxID=361077 RepID=A0A151ZJU0_TIELA|nr:hypothetical protein DLAC_04511 [Tieghemostelium lacteum]|eukprot:KYQ94216.1 hypothetical protein DLAC_04511 [Tieghemostelium lacteum]